MHVIDILIAMQWDADEHNYTEIWEPLESRHRDCKDVWFWLMRWEGS